MAIMVQYKNNEFAYVRNELLDELIDGGTVVAFKRANGWVEIGRDPLRGKGAQSRFDGPERRIAPVKMNCLTCSDFIDALCRTNACSSRVSWQGKSF